MTLLDAPKYDEARARRRQVILYSSVATLFVLFIVWWLVAGRPVDWPWNWNNYLFGEATINTFMKDVEQNNLSAAYGVWYHDKNWPQHAAQYSSYPFNRFQQDWGANSPENEFGTFKTHKIAAARMYGNVLLAAILINGRTSGALDLAYDPRTHTLDFAPPGVRLSTVPFEMKP